MRICSPQLGLSPQATLGGEVYDRETLMQLAARGVSCDIILPVGAAVPDAVPNWQLTRVPLRRGYRWFVSNPLFVPYIGRVYRKRPFHLLRVHSLRFTGLAALWARSLYHLPVPIVMHHHHLEPDRWTNHVDRRAALRADLIITVSQFAKEQLVSAFDLNPEKVAVVYNGVNETYKPVTPMEKSALRSQFGLGENLLLLHVGSFIPRKNLHFLIQSFQVVVNRFPTAKLLLVGRGPQKTGLAQLVQALGITEQVQFLGHLSENEKIKAYQMADLLVSSSKMEGFGLAVAEAMACGLPVIAGRAGALPEVISDQETGILVPANDQDAFVEAICDLLPNQSRAQRMGQAGHKCVNNHFRWHITANQTEVYYRKVL